MKTTPRIVFFGMNGAFTETVFQTLLDEGHTPAGVILPHPVPQGGHPIVSPHPALAGGGILIPPKPRMSYLAGKAGIQTLWVNDLHHPKARHTFERMAPDLVVIACFHRILPRGWLRVPRWGCLNLHPSLLPAYRGPSPLFWQFRAGERTTGISLHWLDARVDTGPLAAQAAVPLPEGCTMTETDRLMGAAGARLLLPLLANPAAIPRIPQSGISTSS